MAVDRTDMRIIILMGAPGAGKGTAATRLVDRLGCRHLSTGALLRESVENATEAGREAAVYIEAGNLVPDALISRMVVDEIMSGDSGLFLLDGFPRTIVQAEILQQTLASVGSSVAMVCNLDVPRDVLISRLSGRLVCPRCGDGYHVVTLKPRREGYCDRCDIPLVQRDDDTMETIIRRLSVYEEQTAPLIPWYEERGLLWHVKGDRQIDVVVAEIAEKISEYVTDDSL